MRGAAQPAKLRSGQPGARNQETVMRLPVRFLLLALVPAIAPAQQPTRPHPAATLGLVELIPWAGDKAEFYDNAQTAKVTLDRGKIVDEACARAKAENKLVLWYVHRIQEQQLGGRQ